MKNSMIKIGDKLKEIYSPGYKITVKIKFSTGDLVHLCNYKTAFNISPEEYTNGLFKAIKKYGKFDKAGFEESINLKIKNNPIIVTANNDGKDIIINYIIWE